MLEHTGDPDQLRLSDRRLTDRRHLQELVDLALLAHRVAELSLVPQVVAFDRRGGRLGYGGGFYDRTLERLRAIRPTYAVGFAYAAQEADTLPLEAFGPLVRKLFAKEPKGYV